MPKNTKNTRFIPLALGTLALLSVEYLSLNNGDNDSIAATNDLGSAFDNIDPALISTADSSTLLSALADGINPNDTLLSTTFYCYSTETTDVSTPDVTLIVDGNKVSYQSEAQSGKGRIEQIDDTDQVVMTADGQTQKFRLELTRFGQILKWPASDNLMDDCVQQGAAHNSALHQYALNTPKPSEWICWDNTEEKTEHTLDLHENNSYRINGESGRYNLTGIVGKTFSDIDFESGPLSAFTAEYSENSASGIQSIKIYLSDSKSTGRISRSSRKELIGNCARQSTPRPFKRYSNIPAKVPPLPKKPIRGLYNLGPSVYIEFFEDGYVKLETEEPTNGDCMRRYPSGMPICATYEFNGSTLSLTNDEGTQQTRAKVSKDGTVQYVQHLPMTPVEALDKSTLVGGWIAESGSVGDINMCILGYCNSSVNKQLFHFSNDGRFMDESNGSSIGSVNATGVSLGANSDRASSRTGDYTVNGPYLNLNYDSGEKVTVIGYRPDSVFLNLGHRQFRRLSDK